jgi:hypothetical protein
MKKLYTLVLLVLVALTSQAQVVISQVYGGGGNSGATFTNDFIELFNRGTSPQDLTGWSVQYSSATGTSWFVTRLPNFTLQPGKYFLIQQAAGSNNITALPTPDLNALTCGCTYNTAATPAVITTGIAMNGTNGKVILVNSTVAETTANPTGSQIIDKMGFGTADGYEGTTAVAALTNSTAAIRLNRGCKDDNLNNSDFSTGTPTPRNSSTAAYSCTAPSLSLLSPANNTVFNPLTSSVNISFEINNFNVANGSTGNGHIKYSINSGTAIMKYDTTPIAIPVTSGNSYTVAIELVNNSNQSLSPAVGVTLTFSVASFITVANLAALRADVITNGAGRYYQLSSNPVVTYTRTARNQKYIQDTSGGILIDDNVTAPGVITTSLSAGDAISGLKGQASLFNGLLQLLPIADVIRVTSNNSITPQVVTIAELNNATAILAGTYESELVQINGVTFDTTTPTFPASTATAANINLTIGSDVLTFRTAFSEANYMGTAKPTGSTNIIALVGRYDTSTTSSAQVTSRSASDLNVPLSSSSFDNINGLTMYPNPVSGNTLYLTSTANAAMSVQIFDLLGKEVLKATVVNNTLNVAKLTAGVYVVKITEEGKTATRKLVIQ